MIRGAGPVRRRNLGLLFGPREAGCWEFLLGQAWISCLVAAAIGWLAHSPVAWKVARGCFAEAMSITLLLTSVAQWVWLEERFPQIPDACFTTVGYMALAFFPLLFVNAFFSSPLLSLLALACFAIPLFLLVLSLLTRIFLALGERLRGPR